MVGERFCDRIEFLDLNSQMWLNVLVKHQTNKHAKNRCTDVTKSDRVFAYFTGIFEFKYYSKINSNRQDIEMSIYSM
jgi:hypothetical protein